MGRDHHHERTPRRRCRDRCSAADRHARVARTTHPRRAARPSRPLSHQAIELIAFRLRILGEPARIRLLEALDEGEASVSELASRLGTTHQNVARHLGLLHEAGVVSRRKEGGVNRYALDDWTAWWLVEQVSAALGNRVDDPRGAPGAGQGRVK